MIVEIICTPLLLFVKGIIAMLPILTYIPNSIVSTVDLILKAMQFFPADVWIMVIRKHCILDNITFNLCSYSLYFKIDTIY